MLVCYVMVRTRIVDSLVVAMNTPLIPTSQMIGRPLRNIPLGNPHIVIDSQWRNSDVHGDDDDAADDDDDDEAYDRK